MSTPLTCVSNQESHNTKQRELKLEVEQMYTTYWIVVT